MAIRQTMKLFFSNAAKLYLFNLTEKHFRLLNFNEVKTLVKSTVFRKLLCLQPLMR